jgi:hypothetical protein
VLTVDKSFTSTTVSTRLPIGPYSTANTSNSTVLLPVGRAERIVKRKVTERATEEEIVEESAPASSLDDPIMDRLQDMLRQAVAPL